MKGTEYYDFLLKQKEWRLKRREIFKRDGFKCTVCGATKSLEVHHTYYTTDTKPWEYPDDCFLTLCHICHYKYHTEHEIPVYDRKTNEFIRNKKNRRKAGKKRHKERKIVILKEGISFKRKTRPKKKSKNKVYSHQKNLGHQDRIKRELDRVFKKP